MLFRKTTLMDCPRIEIHTKWNIFEHIHHCSQGKHEVHNSRSRLFSFLQPFLDSDEWESDP